MKTYSGNKNPNEAGPKTVYVSDNGTTRILDPLKSQKIRNHSPDGFQWGYGGSGPAQLALAILLDLGYNTDQASEIYQQFKGEVVSILPSIWVMTEIELRSIADKLLKEKEK
jgi:hypothetical protein